MSPTPPPTQLPRLGITVGDVGGVGPEVVLGALADPDVLSWCAPVVFGPRAVFEACAARCGHVLPTFAASAPTLIEVPLAAPLDAPGAPSAAAGDVAVRAIRAACDAARAGQIDAICTAPIDKHSLRLAGVEHIGHTELLADYFGVDAPLTMFVLDAMRVFFYSRHLSLRDAIEAIDQAGVEKFAARCHRAMESLGFDAPRLALAALNPHASDGGQFGYEEREHLIPAVLAARRSGIDIDGPIAADSVFHLGAQGVYDAVLALYHDQGHIATKTRDFFRTISVTLGLPVLRTSVDHGSAMDIAWQGVASPLSMLEAMRIAANLLGRTA